ncbi:tape measure protein [Microbacterium phage Cen1621]|uniref:Tape measure protein n=1 Tax=Microbacterium phage Cen1621 TaxID=2965191 RepID=A0A9E7TUQ6_9CAUD|nr:tape measure protein [Microbacterium phage Cen1621]
MSNVIGHATLNVVPSTKGFGSKLTGDLGPLGDAGGKTLGNSIGGSLKGAIGPLMAAAGAIGVGAFVGSAIKAAGSLEQSMGALDTVFKGSASQMHTWATGAATSVGLARDEYNGLAVLIGSQLKNAGTPMDDLAGKTNELVVAGADMAAMFGGTTKEAVEAISSALKGERDPIERYGVTLNEAKIQAEMAAQAANGMTFATEEQAKAAATLALIMRQTTDAHGTFARESQTYEGVMQRLGASWDNIVATIGQGFLPVATAGGSILLAMMPTVQGLADKWAALAPAIQGVVEILLYGNYDGGLFAAIDGISEDSGIIDFLFDVREAVLALFSGDFATAGGIFSELIAEGAALRDSLIANVAEALPAMLEGIVAMAPAILTAAVGAWTSLVTALVSVIPTLVTALLGLLPSIVTTLLSLVPMILTAGITLFTGIVQALALALPIIVAAVAAAIPQIVTAVVAVVPLLVESLLTMIPALVEGAVALFTAIVQAIPQIVPPLITAVVELLPVLLTTLVSLIPALIQGAVQLFTALVQAIPIVLPVLLRAIIDLLPVLVSTLIGMIPVLLNGAVQLFTGLVKAIPVIIPQLVRTLIELGPQMVGALIGLVPQLFQAGIDLINGLIRGLWDMAGAVAGALLDIIGGAVDGFLSFLGIHSPSRLMRGFGQNTGEGLALGLKDMRREVGREALGLAEVAADALGGIEASAHVGALTGDVRPSDYGDPRSGGATFITHYHDHSTSQEDKTAKLTRAQDNLKASVAAGVWR